MQQRMTITLDSDVYFALTRAVPPRKRSKFIQDAIRPLIDEDALAKDYADLAADEQNNAEAREWMAGLIGDIPHETW